MKIKLDFMRLNCKVLDRKWLKKIQSSLREFYKKKTHLSPNSNKRKKHWKKSNPSLIKKIQNLRKNYVYFKKSSPDLIKISVD